MHEIEFNLYRYKTDTLFLTRNKIQNFSTHILKMSDSKWKESLTQISEALPDLVFDYDNNRSLINTYED